MFINLIFILFIHIIALKCIDCDFVVLSDRLQEGDLCDYNETFKGTCTCQCPQVEDDYKNFGIPPKLCSIKDGVALICCNENIRNKNYYFKAAHTDDDPSKKTICEDFDECQYNEEIIGVCRLRCPDLKFPKYKLRLSEKRACPDKYGVPFECCINHLQIAYSPELFQLNNTFEEGDFCPYDDKIIGICENSCSENDSPGKPNKFKTRNSICNHQSDGTPIYCCNDYLTTSGIAADVVPFAAEGDPCKHQNTKDGICRSECKKQKKLKRAGITLNMCPNETGKPPLYCCPSLNYADELEKYRNASSGRTFYKKCQEYGQRQLKRIKRRVHPEFDRHSTITYILRIGDGKRIGFRAVLPAGGKSISYGDYPHMAAIGWTDSDGNIDWKCGGTLISDDYVLTAGHCTLYQNIPPDTIRIGDQYLDEIEDPINLPQNFTISNIIKHPKYRHRSTYNDIALIKLNQSITPTQIVQPACLWNDNDDIGDDLVSFAVGYGSTEFAGKNSRELLYIKLQRFEHEDCVNAYKNYAIKSRLQNGILDTQVCAADSEGLQDTCQGDSGGPLEYQINNVHYVYGLTSFGQACPSTVPGVYTKISKYLYWIESIVWPLNE